MNRRNFIQKASLVTLLPFTSTYFNEAFAATSKKIPQWLLAFAPQNDLSIENHNKNRITTPGPDFGAIADRHLLVSPHSCAGFIRVAANGLYLPNSKYYQSATLVKQMEETTDALLKIQHPDGTIDLLETNFHSTPDTAFLVKRLTNAYKLIERSGTKNVANLLSKVKSFLLRGADALTVGGIHTPNHRWVVCGALAQVHSLWPNPKYVKRIEEWLGEGIDLDPDGQFNERSTYIYSSLTDRVLISVAHYLNKPELLEPVRKNLEMSRYYIHPNAEIVTDASGRQDKAVVGNFENYYYPYRYLALKDNNKDFAGMCRFIEETAGKKLITHLDYLLVEEHLWKELPSGNPIPTQYIKAFPYSGLVRIRDGNWDASIVAQNPTWLTFMKGNAVIQGLRLASSFFGKGQFKSEEIKAVDGGWLLTQQLEGPYYQPLPKHLLPSDGDWEKMPRKDRPQSEIQKLTTSVFLKKTAKGMEITVSAEGTDRLPIALEIIFREAGEFKNVEAVPNTTNSWFLKKGYGTYTKDGQTIQFGPGTNAHLNTTLRGALPHTGAPSVFLTGLVPFKHTLTLE